MNCYTKAFEKNSMILRDYLAADRTALANERTFLAYARTAISIVASGMGFLKLFESMIFQVVGYTCFPVAIVVFFAGLKRFIKHERRLKKVRY